MIRELGYFQYAVAITIFTVLFSATMITGNIDQYVAQGNLQDLNISRDDLDFDPNLPVSNAKSIDLKNDFVERSNVEILNSSQVNSTDYESEYVVKLSNESESGWILYQLEPSTNFLTTKVTDYGFFETSNIELEGYVTANVNETPTESIPLIQTQTLEIENSDTNFIRVVFSPSDDHLYSIVEKDRLEPSTLETTSAYISNGAESLSNWFTLITTGLPDILWIISSIISIIGVLIVLELILG